MTLKSSTFLLVLVIAFDFQLWNLEVLDACFVFIIEPFIVLFQCLNLVISHHGLPLNCLINMQDSIIRQGF
jgi:hypothetical protein